MPCFTSFSNELVKTKEKAKKLEVVVRRRGLLDRETLTFELQETKDTIGARDRQIMVCVI